MPQKIFVGNINSGTNEDDLRAIFEEYGEVLGCDVISNYAFVHMVKDEDADLAVSRLHKSNFEGKQIRCEISTKNTQGRRQEREMSDDSSEDGPIKIFVGNIKSGASEDQLRFTFSKFGEVSECVILNNYGFVHMLNKDDAVQAVENLNKSVFEGKVIRCEMSNKRRSHRPMVDDDQDSSDGPQKIFVGNLKTGANEGNLRTMFATYGEVVSCDIINNFGFIHMAKKLDAIIAVQNLHQTDFEGQPIRCELSNSRTQGRTRARDSDTSRGDTYKIFVGNVRDATKANKLQDEFERFGEVTECSIVRGYAFVHMTDERDAQDAVRALNNTDFRGHKIRCELSNRNAPRRSRGRNNEDDDLDHSRRHRSHGDDHHSRSFHPYEDRPQERDRHRTPGVTMDAPYGLRDSYRENLIRELQKRDEYLRNSYEMQQTSSSAPSHLVSPWSPVDY